MSEPLTTEKKAAQCWICGMWYAGANCPECGPPEPWGPTGEELRNLRERDTRGSDDEATH